MNRLLTRQIKKYLGKSFESHRFYKNEDFQKFINAIDQSYDFNEKEVQLLERTLDMSSQELNEANKLLKKQNQVMAELAVTDVLTGLPNRLGFVNNVTHYLNMAERYNLDFSIIFIDLDRFKVINDSLGHHIGDLLLQNVATHLKACLRKADAIARLGGDEFTVLLQGDVSQTAEKILYELSKPFSLDGHEIVITASIGIANYPSDGETLGELLKNADTAMYQAKNYGRNNYKMFKAAMGETATKHMELESKLRRALKRGEFELYYQPQMDMKTGFICCMEALIRWNSPELGLLTPNHFIPLCEETGLIIPIGEWVLDTACRQCKGWQDKGLEDVRVAVNVSSRQLQSTDFLISVTSTLNKSRLDPRLLEIELTESTVMHNPQFAISIFKNLKEMGVQISIDDFGTGYSSLANLKQLTIDKLKIDRSFVSDIDDSPDAKAIVVAIIAMGHILNLRVVAEGVETPNQRDLLKENDCDYLQGFLLGRPKPINEILTDCSMAEQKLYIPVHVTAL